MERYSRFSYKLLNFIEFIDIYNKIRFFLLYKIFEDPEILNEQKSKKIITHRIQKKKAKAPKG